MVEYAYDTLAGYGVYDYIDPVLAETILRIRTNQNQQERRCQKDSSEEESRKFQFPLERYLLSALPVEKPPFCGWAMRP